MDKRIVPLTYTFGMLSQEHSMRLNSDIPIYSIRNGQCKYVNKHNTAAEEKFSATILKMYVLK